MGLNRICLIALENNSLGEILKSLKDFVSTVVNIFKGASDIMVNWNYYVTYFGLSACAIVGTFALLLRICGFNTGKWVTVSFATYILILLFA